VVGQLLASEGFNSVEELALVDEKEIAGIEGFDEETARECRRAHANIWAQIEANTTPNAGARRRGCPERGARVTAKMLVKFGEHEIKTVGTCRTAPPTI